MIFFNSENSIRVIRPFCRPLFCHSSFVKYKSSLLQKRSRYETWLSNITEIAPPKDNVLIHPWFRRSLCTWIWKAYLWSNNSKIKVSEWKKMLWKCSIAGSPAGYREKLSHNCMIDSHWIQGQINNSRKCSNCYGPRASGGPAVFCTLYIKICSV